MLLELDKPERIPRRILQRLEGRLPAFRHEAYLEVLADDPVISECLQMLDEFIEDHQVLACHCTKQPRPGFFEEHGLATLAGARHREWFLNEYGYMFSNEEKRRLEQGWRAYFSGFQNSIRDGTIHFCMSRYLVFSAGKGTDAFFRFFGGEAVFMPFQRDRDLAEKIEVIGSPVVVELRVSPREIQSRQRLSMDLLSHYHRFLNPEAHVYSAEGRVRRDFRPHEILAVHPKDEFFEKYGPPDPIAGLDGGAGMS